MRSSFISRVLTTFGLMVALVTMSHCSKEESKKKDSGGDARACPSKVATATNTVATQPVANTATGTSTNTSVTLAELEEMYLADATIPVPTFADVTALLNKYHKACKAFTPAPTPVGTDDCAFHSTVSSKIETYVVDLGKLGTVPYADLQKLVVWTAGGKPNTTTFTVTGTSTNTGTIASPNYSPTQTNTNSNTNCP